MIFRALPQFTQSLLALPESGMGYQIIDAKRLGRYMKDRFIVYNSELIIEYDNNFISNKRQIQLSSYSNILNQSIFISLESPTLITNNILRNLHLMSDRIMNSKGRYAGGSGAVDNTPVYASGSEIFVRLSAYPDDKRIDTVKMRLRDGSYTTTESDYISCKKNEDDPVDRYALPNDEIIKWAYYIKPKSNDKYRPGIVQPANNHNGGGIEALFDLGTSVGTYIERKPY